MDYADLRHRVDRALIDKQALDDHYKVQILAKDEEIRDLQDENAELRRRLDYSPGWALGGLGETSTATGG